MDSRDPNYVPKGLIKTNPPPKLTIQNKRMLIDYQKKGQFLDADPQKIDFRVLVIQSQEVSEAAGVELMILWKLKIQKIVLWRWMWSQKRWQVQNTKIRYC